MLHLSFDVFATLALTLHSRGRWPSRCSRLLTLHPQPQARRGAYTSDPESLGDIGLFTAAAERTNGRAAMLGLAAMLAAESVTGSALVHL